MSLLRFGKSTSESEDVEGVLLLLRFLPLGCGKNTSESDEEQSELSIKASSASGTEDREDDLEEGGDLCAGVTGLELSGDDCGVLPSIHTSLYHYCETDPFLL